MVMDHDVRKVTKNMSAKASTEQVDLVEKVTEKDENGESKYQHYKLSVLFLKALIEHIKAYRS